MVTLSILTTATLSSKIMQNACLKKLFAKYGSELSWKDMQEITAKFPSKQDFDAKANKDGRWGREEFIKGMGCHGSSVGLYSSFDKIVTLGLGEKCEQILKKFGKKSYSWQELQMFKSGFPDKDTFDSIANNGKWGAAEVKKYVDC